jgi:tRNA threonylcarbamoyladenosine biosynthesis protein TsaB
MRVLALDTTGRAGSSALIVDGRIVDARSGDATRTHAERLPGELTALVRACGLTLPEIDVFAAAVGPGSFTGLRIGIATMQGLSLVGERPLIGVSALEALAHAAAGGAAAGDLVAAWIDAQRGEVFSALYRTTAAAPGAPERVLKVEGPSVASPAKTLEGWSTHDLASATFIGDGATRYAEVVDRITQRRIGAPSALAGIVGQLASARAARGEAAHPAAIGPLYVRRPDAVLDRERRVLTGKGTDTKG